MRYFTSTVRKLFLQCGHCDHLLPIDAEDFEREHLDGGRDRDCDQCGHQLLHARPALDRETPESTSLRSTRDIALSADGRAAKAWAGLGELNARVKSINAFAEEEHEQLTALAREVRYMRELLAGTPQLDERGVTVAARLTTAVDNHEQRLKQLEASYLKLNRKVFP